MSQNEARQLAKLMSKGGSIYVAVTDYAFNGKHDKADARWGVALYSGHGPLILEMPVEYQEMLDAGVES